MKKILLSVMALLASAVLNASPCVKYVYDFDTRFVSAMHGVLTVSWHVNNGPGGCGSGKTLTGKEQFVVEIVTLFEDIIITDTVNATSLRFNTYALHEDNLIFRMHELGSEAYTNPLVITFEREELPVASTKIDSLNYALMNGYFLNVKTLLEDMKRDDLLTEVMSHYRILFPLYYSGRERFFNHSLNTDSITLKRMASVKGRDRFTDALNKLNSGKQKEGFRVYAKISRDNKVLEYSVVPETSKYLFEKASPSLQFINSTGETADAVILISLKGKKSKSYEIVNERALIDPGSEHFQTKFPPPSGAVYR